MHDWIFILHPSQCLSTEVTCESGAALAATLANGGLCPLSGDQVMSPNAVRSTLSVMQVAGMNDYSRMFHFKVSFVTKLVNESYFWYTYIYDIPNRVFAAIKFALTFMLLIKIASTLQS